MLVNNASFNNNCGYIYVFLHIWAKTCECLLSRKNNQYADPERGKKEMHYYG